MRLSFLLSSLFVLGSLGRAAAQGTLSPSVTVRTTVDVTPAEFTTPYTIEHDSLWRRAERIRARTQARIVQFRMSNVALKGTRRKVVSYAQMRRSPSTNNVWYTRVKREISKHKTSSAEVEKRFYYGLRERLLLAEYYEQHQLVRLELHEYPMREGNEYGTVFRTTQWLRGDYLRLTTHAQEKRGKATQYFYTEDRAPR